MINKADKTYRLQSELIYSEEEKCDDAKVINQISIHNNSTCDKISRNKSKDRVVTFLQRLADFSVKELIARQTK